MEKLLAKFDYTINTLRERCDDMEIKIADFENHASLINRKYKEVSDKILQLSDKENAAKETIRELGANPCRSDISGSVKDYSDILSDIRSSALKIKLIKANLSVLKEHQYDLESRIRNIEEMEPSIAELKVEHADLLEELRESVLDRSGWYPLTE